MKNLLRRCFARKPFVPSIPAATAIDLKTAWLGEWSTTLGDFDCENIDLSSLEDDIDAFSQTFKKK